MDDLQNIQNLIYVIRGQRVMLDSDIAGFYGVETKRLNEKVKRNPKRFAGEDFMFQLTQEEYDDLRLRSQIATIKKGRGSHSKYLPHVFTLLGVSMLSSVLESDTAIEANRRIMRAQLDAISTALAELQAKPSEPKPRKPIGFIQTKEDEDKE
jgi:hypothetical protein